MIRLLVLPLMVLLAGCYTYTSPRYAVSLETVQMLRSFKGQTVALGPFTAAEPGRTTIMCRGGGPVEAPGRDPFETFIRKAFMDELAIADVYAPSAPVTLTGHIEIIDFTTGIFKGSWTIALALRSSNGQMIAITHVHPFESAYVAEAACSRVAQALAPATQELIAKFVRHPHFPALLRTGS